VDEEPKQEPTMPYEYAPDYRVAAQAESTERAAFIRRTYAHLAGAILAFIGLEALLLMAVKEYDLPLMQWLGASRGMWLIIMIAWMGASWVANMWARSETSVAVQYLGLGLYVVAEALIMLPLLYIAQIFAGPGTIATAGILTLCVFGGLTVSVFITRKDYSFLGPIISVASLIALGVILASFLFSFNLLGVFFAFAMVGLMAACILYQTSGILLHYRTDQHVAAALGLFASVATLFWWILRILMIFNRR
jgi:FtsH-binding integral membrane protein